MAEFARVNGIGHVHATLYSTVQLSAFVFNLGASAAAQGGIGGAIEAVARELGSTLVMFQSVGTAGAFHAIMDGHGVDADSLQVRIQALGTVNAYDLSGATVALGTAITVS
mgnify:CR=1 FL=1|jgi:hypothetical protein|tara:strand:+ start:7533 stop:7865 length:333 start_codon:yes stop_codon:yes gene_type:complete